jgi:beta-xylosidase
MPAARLRSLFRVDPRVLIACALPWLLASAPPRSSRDVRRPNAAPHDFADPYVIRDGDAYYAFATGAGRTHVQLAWSHDLDRWEPLADALPRMPAWAAADPRLTWAPAVLRRERHYVLYYTARHLASGFQCISRGTAPSVRGPYVDEGSSPLSCPVSGSMALCGAIDPSPFVDRDGRAYLLWKSDENSAVCHAAPRLWSQLLSEDGTELVGPPTQLLRMDQSWEAPIIEGPSMILHEGVYFLFYSGGYYDSAGYAIGYARCASPSGPCTKATTDAPLLKSSGNLLGPGGQEVFTDGQGAAWLAYHAWTAPLAAYAEGGLRSLRIAPLAFEASAPVIGHTSALHPRLSER